MFIFCKNISLNFFITLLYSTTYDLGRIISYTTLPAVIEIDSLMWFGTLHLKIHTHIQFHWAMNNLLNIFLEFSNLGFVHQRQKSRECQWVGFRMIGACLMNGLSIVADTRASQPIFRFTNLPSLRTSGPRSHTAQAARQEVWAAVLHCKNVLLVVPIRLWLGRHFVNNSQ